MNPFKLIASVVLPKRCFSCKNELSHGEEIICTSCRHKLTLTGFNFSDENELDHKFYGISKIKKSSCLFYYHHDAVIKPLLHQLKYQDQEHLGVFFANWVYASIQSDSAFPKIDLIVPVPLHWLRAQERGYNQLDLFSRTLSQLLGIPYEKNNLIKLRNSLSKTTKNRAERLADKNPFHLKNPDRIKGKQLLLVDDLCTTGITLVHAAQAIHQKADCKIFVYTLAMVSHF